MRSLDKYRPETVITSWMTLKTEDPEGVDAGHKYAPDEDEIFKTGVTYIHIGNDLIHSERYADLIVLCDRRREKIKRKTVQKLQF